MELLLPVTISKHLYLARWLVRKHVFRAAVVLVVVCLYFTSLNPWRWAPEAVIGPYEGVSNDFPYVNMFIGTKKGGKLPSFINLGRLADG